jgi:Elongation factor Tu GTP binding domain
MSQDDLNESTKKLEIGGGGGPKFSFKTTFNTAAVEFVPSWGPPAGPIPAVAPVQQPAKAVSISLENNPKPIKKAVVAKKEAVAPKKEKEKEIPKKEKVVEEEEKFDMTGVKENVNILFMGHVDAGKSTMGGHILLLTGMVDKRTMEKYEIEAKELGRESWYLSWALDLNQEERDKGKTTEYGRGLLKKLIQGHSSLKRDILQLLMHQGTEIIFHRWLLKDPNPRLKVLLKQISVSW